MGSGLKALAEAARRNAASPLSHAELMAASYSQVSLPSFGTPIASTPPMPSRTISLENPMTCRVRIDMLGGGSPLKSKNATVVFNSKNRSFTITLKGGAVNIPLSSIASFELNERTISMSSSKHAIKAQFEKLEDTLFTAAILARSLVGNDPPPFYSLKEGNGIPITDQTTYSLESYRWKNAQSGLPLHKSKHFTFTEENCPSTIKKAIEDAKGGSIRFTFSSAYTVYVNIISVKPIIREVAQKDIKRGLDILQSDVLQLVNDVSKQVRRIRLMRAAAKYKSIVMETEAEAGRCALEVDELLAENKKRRESITMIPKQRLANELINLKHLKEQQQILLRKLQLSNSLEKCMVDLNISALQSPKSGSPELAALLTAFQAFATVKAMDGDVHEVVREIDSIE